MKVKQFYSKFPEIAYSMGVPRVISKTLFNNQICKAIKEWEKQNGIKFTGKVLPNTRTNCSHTFLITGDIHLNTSDIFVLFHELEHWKQRKKSTITIQNNANLQKRISGEFLHEKKERIYYQCDFEKLANQAAKRNIKMMKIKKKANRSAFGAYN